MKNPRDAVRRRVLSFVGNHLAPSMLVHRRVAGKVPLGSHRRLVLFAHFDPQGIVDPCVVHLVSKLAELGADVVVASSSPRLADVEIEKLVPWCSVVLHRRNISLDWGSWHAGYLEVRDRINQYEQIVLSNDSVYGPLRNLADVFAEMDHPNRKVDLWGITDSYERHYHLQSYFLVFNRRLIENGFFEAIWDDFKYHWSKDWIIGNYELGVTGEALRRTARVGAFIPSDEFRKKLLSSSAQFQYREQLEKGHLNPTLYFWDRLITDFGCPFLKTEVLKLNRHESEALPRWREIAGQPGYFDPALIEAQGRRLGLLTRVGG